MENKIEELIKNKYSQMQNFDVNSAWQKVVEKLSIEENKSHKIMFLIKKPLRIAALTILFLSMTTLLYLLINKSKNYINFYTNEKKLISLPDKSQVLLNKASKIKYYKNFTNNREIFLDGEAYLLVKKMDNKPFRLIIRNGTIIVVGTSFYVTSKKNVPTKIYVEEGKVILKKNIKNFFKHSIIINAGYFYNEFDNNNYYLGKNFDVNFIAWKTGKIVFSYTPLYKVAETLENIYGYKIIFDDKIKNCEYTATFNDQNFNSIIKTIAKTFDLTIYKKSEKKYILKPKNEIKCN